MKSKEINKDWGSTPSERIKWLRESMGMNRKEFRDKLTELYPAFTLGYSTVQGWERDRVPRSHALSILSEFFGCSKDFILCKTDEYYPSVSSNYSEISKDDLHLYNGEPIWVSKRNKKGKLFNNYALINSTAGYIVFADRSIVYIDSLTEDTRIYVRNIHTKYTSLEPISLELAKTLDKVYIMELNASPSTSPYAGYYTYNAHTKCFEKEDQTIILRDTAYNKSYVAYAQPPALSVDL